jgi:hypothetical protein
MDKAANGTITRATPATIRPAPQSSSTPKWFKYLAACYPSANLTDLTPIAYKREFAAVDEAEMMQAAELHVKRSKWFPTIAELRQATLEIEKAGINEQWLIGWDTAEVLRYKRAAASWPTCPNCEERTPDLNNCPFCADMVEAGD